jgi:hypothetical protein
LQFRGCGVKAVVTRMCPRHLAAVLVAAFSCAPFAASCVQSQESPAIEAKDDGDFGGDPDTSSGIGSEPNWSWTSSTPSIGGSVGDPDPDTSPSIGGGDLSPDPQGGCSPSPPRPTCLDMYEECQDKKGPPCERDLGGITLCGACLLDCRARRPYKLKQCTQCGFE